MDDRIARDVTKARIAPTPAAGRTGRVRIGKAVAGLLVVLLGVAFIHNGGLFDLLCGVPVVLYGLTLLRRVRA